MSYTHLAAHTHTHKQQGGLPPEHYWLRRRARRDEPPSAQPWVIHLESISFHHYSITVITISVAHARTPIPSVRHYTYDVCRALLYCLDIRRLCLRSTMAFQHCVISLKRLHTNECVSLSMINSPICFPVSTEHFQTQSSKGHFYVWKHFMMKSQTPFCCINISLTCVPLLLLFGL